MGEEEIVNRVAASSLVSFDLATYYSQGDRAVIDIRDQLVDDLLLREKEFRQYVKSTDWSRYSDFFVAIHCSADAIVPTWAFMLLAGALEPHARKVVFVTLEDLEFELYREALGAMDWSQFTGKRVVVKGCSKFPVPVAAYVLAMTRLRAVASSVMYGEPCSTVPLFKRGADK